MMGRQYSSAEAFKQAVEHRLREQATRDAVELARLRQFLVFDRLLARVAEVFGDHLVVKGGFAVELRLERARTTKDIDLQLTEPAGDVLAKLQEAGRLNLGDFLTFEIRADPRHSETKAEVILFQGHRYRVRPMLAGKVYGSPFGVDVALAGRTEGDIEALQSSSFLAFAGVEPVTLHIYPVEFHIAEKLHAYTLPRPRPNSRVKDLPDIALLASAGVLEGAALRSAMEHTFRARATHELPSAVPAPPVTWKAPYDRMARSDGLPWSTLLDLHVAVAAFLDPALAGHVAAWDPLTWTWAQPGAKGDP